MNINITVITKNGLESDFDIIAKNNLAAFLNNDGITIANQFAAVLDCEGHLVLRSEDSIDGIYDDMEINLNDKPYNIEECDAFDHVLIPRKVAVQLKNNINSLVLYAIKNCTIEELINLLSDLKESYNILSDNINKVPYKYE